MSTVSRPSARVVIVTRTKNRPRLLRRAIEDILQQTFEDWTLVVVNDGGESAEVDAVLADFQEQLAGRLLVLHHAESLGMEAASNRGIAAADSEYIAVHDDDDEWAPEFLATTVAHLDSHPDDGGVTVETEIVFEKLTATGREVEERVIFEPQLHAITLVDQLHYNRFVPISFLFRRSVYDELGGFDESLAVVGDWEFHLRFLVRHHIGYIKGRPLAFWNQRRGATDADANSVIAGDLDHHVYSLKVRDRLVREHAAAYGLGPLVYQRELMAAEVGRFHARIDELQRGQEALLEEVRALRAALDEERQARGAWSQLPGKAFQQARSALRR
ncbi:glycosyl transferase [Sinomonas sp. R1AF57]|nr:glycosyl transferase [Sinomonas sp. R1AF57]